MAVTMKKSTSFCETRLDKMSRQGTIEKEPEMICELCGKLAETRPYGPREERVCFQCGMKDELAAKRQFNIRVFGEDLN